MILELSHWGDQRPFVLAEPFVYAPAFRCSPLREEAWREHPLFANAKDCGELATKTLNK